MRAGEFLQCMEDLPVKGFDEIAGLAGGLVILAPHPDDESLGCGGLIAMARERAREVRIVILSDGIGSHPNSLTYPPARLRALRRDETRAAAANLGLPDDDVIFLDLPDRYVPSSGAVAEAVVASIISVCRSVDARALFVTWEHDPHVDHRATHDIARAVVRELRHVRLFCYPIWAWTLPAESDVGDKPVGARIDVSRHLAKKRAAIASHRSQTTDLINDDHGFCLSASTIERLCGPYEIYIEQFYATERYESTSAAFFDSLYAENSDPWELATSGYEDFKYQRTISALEKDSYDAGLEIGCSIGVLTERLARRCASLIAIDASALPLISARQRCSTQPWVSFKQMFVPHQWPNATFDIILLSEVIYYLTKEDLSTLADKVISSLRVNGEVILVNWTGANSCPQTGDQAAEGFLGFATTRLEITGHERHETFRVDTLRLT